MVIDNIVTVRRDFERELRSSEDIAVHIVAVGSRRQESILYVDLEPEAPDDLLIPQKYKGYSVEVYRTGNSHQNLLRRRGME